jgi:mannosyltransferase OCH1-like enzyme
MIPKIIHQVWVGGEMPRSLKENTKGIKAMNPEFKYKLWTNKDLKTFNLGHLLEEALHPVFACDIFRLKILEKFGGLYLDVDYQPVVPLSDWFLKYNRYKLSSIYIDNIYPDIGTIIAKPNINYNIVLKDYKPIEPMGFYWQRMNPHPILEEEVGKNGTILKDIRINSWTNTYKNSLK